MNWLFFFMVCIVLINDVLLGIKILLFFLCKYLGPNTLLSTVGKKKKKKI